MGDGGEANGASRIGGTVRVLLFSASRREGSLNTRLAGLAQRTMEQAGASVDAARMADFDCPSYDGDVEAREGIPAPAQELVRRLGEADALVIASPEYNAAMPGILKNAIDWASRHRPQPFHQKHCLLMSASPSMVGGNRGLWSLRVPLEHLGARVYPDMFSLAQAHAGFTEEGGFEHESLQGRFEATLGAFLELVEASTHYACMRSAWVEFLGEPPVAAIDRVE